MVVHLNKKKRKFPFFRMHKNHYKLCIFYFVLFILQLGGNYMNLSIREHIINNFKGDDYDTLRRAIDESVASQDEVTLPGLGVFLEIIWENADQELKNQLIEIIKKRVEKGLQNAGDEGEKKES